jgi:protoporphyrinogen oxidase
VNLFPSLEEKPKTQGFGILFPRQEQFRSLGVLFDENIFGGESGPSETYILGGALDNICGRTDKDLLEIAKEDRRKLFPEGKDPVGFHISRWDRALPHYSVKLEENLLELKDDFSRLEKDGIFFVGNYLGGIGLSQLLENSQRLPSRIAGHE